MPKQKIYSREKKDEIFNELPNVFGIADYILVVAYNNDGTDWNRPLYRIWQICEKENIKLNKDNCHFRCISIPFLAHNFQVSHKTRLLHVVHTNRKATTKIKVGTTINPWHNELLMQVLTSNCRSMQAKSLIKKDAYMNSALLHNPFT